MRSLSRTTGRLRGFALVVGLALAGLFIAPAAQAAGALDVQVRPGDPIYGSGVQCVIGANVTDGAKHYFVTAGHCAQVAGQ